MLLTLKNKLLRIRDTKTGIPSTVLLDFEGDNVLVIMDGNSVMPEFIHRIELSAFPTDAVLADAIGKAMNAPVEIIQTLDRDIRLDSSDLLGLEKMPVDIFDNRYLDEVKQSALTLCIDIRNFSKFLRDNKDEAVFELIKNFTSNFLSCVNQFGIECSYYKLLGDGAIVIWDETTEETLEEALQVFDTFLEFANEELFTPYSDLGFGGALVTDMVYKYEISAETSQLKYRDYVGYGINLACRLQALACCNELIINTGVADTGLVPYTARDPEEYRNGIALLKGLKEEDLKQVLFYEKQDI